MREKLMSSKMKLILITIIIIITLNSEVIESRKHHLTLTNDIRKYLTVSTFGFFVGGSLSIKVERFSSIPYKKESSFGFTLAKTMSDSLTPYLEGHQDECLLKDDVANKNDDNIGLLSMTFDLENNLVVLNCNEKLSKLRLYPEYKPLSFRGKRSNDQNELSFISNKTQSQTKVISNETPKNDKEVVKDAVNDTDNKLNRKTTDAPLATKKGPEIDNANNLVVAKDKAPRQDVINKVAPDQKDTDQLIKQTKSNELKSNDEQSAEQKSDEKKTCSLKSVKLVKSGDQNRPEFSFEIQAIIAEDSQEGLYSLFFHNCPNYGVHGGFRQLTAINLSMSIVEANLDNYLSAGEIPLPQLYFALSVIFFLVGVIWVHVIRNKRDDAFKIHYLMAALVFVKAFSLLFHGINYHFIAKEGSQVETWAVLYYITHLLKGALLFITIVLIGTGWAFIKHILSDKDKKIFMIVIPLQVLANIADIITEESEEGELKHNMWREIFILVDLLCCGAILFPVVWSIRHLQEASQTDGKAAINLKKLKLFRHFYVMIVCYIYFTRIIVYLLKITVPFQYEWLNVFFQHTATLLFFLLTGYHFQPTSTNPYFQLSQEEDDLEMEEVLFVQPNSFSETKKRNRDIEANDNSSLITKRESSHDFD